MSNDLISREALLQALVNLEPSGYERSFAGQAAIREILNAPAVDAVEVVRCQDCQHWQCETNDHIHWICKRYSNEKYICRTQPTFFCANGRKKNGGTDNADN